MSETTAEYKAENKVKNTAILTENEGAINSKDFFGYAIGQSIITTGSPDGHDEVEKVQYMLVACKDSGEENILIGNFVNQGVVINALRSLLQAIDNGDRVWDFQDHDMPF